MKISQGLALTFLLSVKRPVAAAEQELREFLAWPLQSGLTAYQRYVSPYKSGSCSMMPSDSAYARQALRRYGPLRGTLMTFDRLHRCGHDAGSYRVVMTKDGPRLWDPVDPNARTQP